jgi:hypothetical protein
MLDFRDFIELSWLLMREEPRLVRRSFDWFMEVSYLN